MRFYGGFLQLVCKGTQKKGYGIQSIAPYYLIKREKGDYIAFA